MGPFFGSPQNPFCFRIFQHRILFGAHTHTTAWHAKEIALRTVRPTAGGHQGLSPPQTFIHADRRRNLDMAPNSTGEAFSLARPRIDKLSRDTLLGELEFVAPRLGFVQYGK